MTTVLAIPIAAGTVRTSPSTMFLNVRVCFQFISDDHGLPEMVKNWTDVVSKLGLKVDLYQESSLGTSIGSSVWSGIEKKEEAHLIWSAMIGSGIGANSSKAVELSWVPSDIRTNQPPSAVQTYSVKHLLSGWKKSKTMQMLSATGLRSKEPLRLTEDEKNALNAFWLFHAPPKDMDANSKRSANQNTASVSDLALFATQHPGLAKRVGLVCDLRIESPVHVTGGENLLLRATVADKTIRTPFTACTLREDSNHKAFLPRPAAGDESFVGGIGGTVRMRKQIAQGKFTPIYYLESLDYVASLHREEVTKDVATSSGTLQREVTGGLALIRDGIEAPNEAYRFAKLSLPDGQQEYVMYAGGLLYGYRIDLRKDGRWLPLCKRHVTYSASNINWEELDEGMVSPNPVTDNGGGPQKHEEVLRWTTSGSLVSGPPGKMANGDEPPPTSFGSLGYRVGLPPAMLAPCRFRHEYAMRMRCVFAGGYSLEITDVEDPRWVTDEGFTEPHRYRRSESVIGPTVVTDPENPGICNSLGDEGKRLNEHRVICSRDIKNGKRAVRIIHPPIVTEEDVILLGGLDSMTPDHSYHLLEQYANFVPRSAQDPRGLPDPDAIGASFRFRLRGENTVAAIKCHADKKETQLLPGCEASGSLSFYQGKRTWPRTRPIRLEVEALSQGPSAVSFDWNSGRVRVLLAPGATVDCDISSIPRTTNNRQLEMDKVPQFSSIAEDYLVPNALLLGDFEVNLLASLSPVDSGASANSSLVLKHATRKPVDHPIWGSPVVVRTKGANLAIIRDSPVFDRGTTGTISLGYEWEEVSCAEVAGGLTRARKTGSSEEIDVGEDLHPRKNGVQLEHNQLDFKLLFNDTKARDITAHVIAHGQFADCFAGASNSERQSISTDQKFVIPNSAIPTPPVARFALPLTALERDSKDWVRRSVRKGNAIRIYLDGCWSETGRGELLGILCAPQSQSELSDSDRRKNEAYFSQWGSEVLLRTTSMGDGPHVHHFEWATVLFDGVNAFTPEEMKKGSVGERPAIIAGHAVAYDLRTKSWYSDVSVATARRSFLPWIRFGLVRFQPDSIEGCHISPVVLSTFCQFLPDRTVTVVRSQADRRKIRISVAGIGPISDRENDLRLRSVLEVSVLGLTTGHSGPVREGHLDEQGQVWVEQSTASLPWHAREDGNGSYAGDVWLPESGENQTRFIIREILKCSLPGSEGSGRPILLESVKI